MNLLTEMTHEEKIKQYNEFVVYLSEKDKNDYERKINALEKEKDNLTRKYNEIASVSISKKENIKYLMEEITKLKKIENSFDIFSNIISHMDYYTISCKDILEQFNPDYLKIKSNLEYRPINWNNKINK